jgi:hypothetical protein
MLDGAEPSASVLLGGFWPGGPGILFVNQSYFVAKY